MKKMTLTQLVDQSIQYLNACEYSDRTIGHYSDVWNSLLKYSKEKGVQYYTLDFGMEFIVNHYGVGLDSKLSQHHVALLRPIRALDDIKQFGQAMKKYARFSPKITCHYFKIYGCYEEQLKERGLSSGTIANKIVTTQPGSANQASLHFGTKGFPRKASRIASNTGAEFFLTVEM